MAFDDVTLEPLPTWTALDQDYPNLVAEWSIDRGRAFELDRVDTGRATVTINDVDGVLDPTNSSSPFAGDIQPLRQARLGLWNPVVEDWYTRFRGFVESYVYEFDPSQLVNRVTIELVDIFEIVSAVEMFPGFFGDPAPGSSAGNVFMEDTLNNDVHGMQRRVVDIIGDEDHSSFSLGSVGLPQEFYEVFSGNVSIHEGVYSPGESAMAAVQEAVDAEFPGVGNVYGNRLGKLAVHGRYARFDPAGTSTATDWDYHAWEAGDGDAVNASPTDTAHIRSFALSRDLGKIINHALASPKTNIDGLHYDEKITANTVQPGDAGTSKGRYGIRTWSTQDLLTKEGVTDALVYPGSPTAAELAENQPGWDETKLFAQYYAQNYAGPQNRISQIGFRSMHPDWTGAGATWALFSEVDIGDTVGIIIGSPGGGGISYDAGHPNHNRYFVEGVHEQLQPLNDHVDDYTLTLDLSPFAYYEDSPFADPP